MDPYTDREKRDLLKRVADGEPGPRCPRCQAPCAVIRTGPRDDVSYVRDRVVMRCSGCTRGFGVEAGDVQAR